MCIMKSQSLSRHVVERIFYCDFIIILISLLLFCDYFRYYPVIILILLFYDCLHCHYFMIIVIFIIL